MNENTVALANEVSPKKEFVHKKELWVFGLSALGQGMIYNAMSSYISDFYISVMGLAPLFVMLLMLFARVWDAINDPIMGIIADKYDSKHGKYKPYIMYAVLPIVLLTFLMFFVPNFTRTENSAYNEKATYIWVSFIYVFWGMAYTVADIPFWSLPNAMTPDAKERGKVISFARIPNAVGIVVPMGIVMGLGYADISYETRYLIMGIVCSVFGGLLYIANFFTTKERVKIPKVIKTANHISPLKLIFTNKQLMLVVIMGVLSSGRYMLQAASVHVSRYTFYIEGMDVMKSQSTVQLVFSIATAIGMFGAMLACPALIKKFSYKSLLIGTCAIGAISGIGGYVIGLMTNYNLWALLPFLVIASLPLGIINVVSYAMIGDCIDKIELDKGQRPMGLGTACQAFVNKLGNALATTMIIAMYMIVGFNVNDMASVSGKDIELINPTTLSNGIRHGMYMLVTLIPAVSLALCCIPIFFYDLTGKKKEEMLVALEDARTKRNKTIQDEYTAEKSVVVDNHLGKQEKIKNLDKNRGKFKLYYQKIKLYQNLENK